MSNLKTVFLMFVNVNIIALMLTYANNLYHFVKINNYLEMSELAVIVLAVSFSPSSTGWYAKSIERMTFLGAASAYLATIYSINLII